MKPLRTHTQNTLLLFVLAGAVTGCRTEENPTPETKGKLVIYTKLTDTTYDRIYVYLNQKKVGSLNRSYTGLGGRPIPECTGEPTDYFLRLEVPTGIHQLQAKLMKGIVTTKELPVQTIDVTTDQCLPVQLKQTI